MKGIPMLLQTIELRQWVPHLDRARAEGVEAWLRPGESFDEDHQIFSATSGTIDGLLYDVEYTADATGQHGKCNCEAGKNGQNCKHMAVVALRLGIITEQAVSLEARRIKSELAAEREKAETQRKAIRAAEKLAAEKAALSVSNWIRVQPDHPEFAGRKGVIEAVYNDGTLRVTLEHGKGVPAQTTYLLPMWVKPYKRPTPQSQLPKDVQDKGMAAIMAKGAA